MVAKIWVNLGEVARRKPVLKVALLVALALTIGLGGMNQAQAASNSVTITIMRGATLWARPSLTSRVVVMLRRGNRFTITARSASGFWLWGVSDRGTFGWLLNSVGFRALHPTVNVNALVVVSGPTTVVSPTVRRTAPVVPATRPVVPQPPMVQPGTGGY